MNKKMLLDAVATASSETVATVERVLRAFVDVTTDALYEDDEVRLPGFGTFKATTRKARKARNPHTGETIDVPEKRAPKFKPSKTLKDAMN